MIYSHTGFSLTEVLIATLVLTIGVFGIYALISNNSLLLESNRTLTQAKQLEYSLKECVFYQYDDIIFNDDNFSIDFGNDLQECNLGDYNTAYTFTGVTVHDQTFYLYGTLSGSEIHYNIFNESIGTLYETDKLLE